ncbi:MAG: hypothetical protein ACRC5A_00790 [Enterobacteriaceae bacterium]
MAINFSSLNPSLITQVATANSLHEAVKMSFIDKIIGWFQGGTMKADRQELFVAFSRLKEAGLSEQARLDHFLELRQSVKQEYRDKFQIELTEHPNGNWGYRLKIDGESIYDNEDISDYDNYQSLPYFQVEVSRQQLEEGCKNGDAELLELALKNSVTCLAQAVGKQSIAGSMAAIRNLALYADIAWSSAASAEDQVSAADKKQAFSHDLLTPVITALKPEARELLYSELNGSVGTHLRSLCSYAADLLKSEVTAPSSKLPMDNIENRVLLSMPTKLELRLLNLLSILSSSLGIDEQKLEKPPSLDPSGRLAPDEVNALKAMGIAESIINQ